MTVSDNTRLRVESIIFSFLTSFIKSPKKVLCEMKNVKLISYILIVVRCDIAAKKVEKPQAW